MDDVGINRNTLTERVTRKLTGIRHLDWSLVAMILAIKGLIFAYGVQSYEVLANKPIETWHGWLEIWNRWDSLHYLEVAQYGYRMIGDSKFRLVLFPLYPWLTRLLACVTGDYLISAFVVSGLATILAGLLLQRLVTLDHSTTIARRAVLFLFIFPTSYFLHIGYTESLFLALALSCFLAARTDRWMLAGVLGALASISRINGLILIPALMIEAIQQYQTTRRWQWSWLSIVAVALGFGGYLLLNYRVAGDPLAFMAMQQEHWYKSLEWPWVGIHGKFDAMWGLSPTDGVMIGAQEMLFIVLGLIGVIWSWFVLRPSYSVWMTLNWLLFTSVGFILCVPRYTLVMFPFCILLAKLAERYMWNVVITIWSLLFLALFASQFVQGRWAF